MKRLYVSQHHSPGGNAKTEEIKKLFDSIISVEPTACFCPEQDPFPDDTRIKAIRYSGLPNHGRTTSVFAYIGFPETASCDSPVPGMVLVHGGAGHAYAEWVRYWIDNGFAAISFDGFGQSYVGADHTYDASMDLWKLDPQSHPPMDGYATIDKPIPEQGFTYYMADLFIAHSILRNDPRVDNQKIGLTGISWGGIASSVAVCYDDRFAFAAPVYGCGFSDASKSVWGTGFREEKIINTWDAKLLLNKVMIPVHFFNGDDDPFFDANSSTASAAAVPLGALTLLPGFTHGQIEGSSIPELLRFAQTQVSGIQKNINLDLTDAKDDEAIISFLLPDGVTDAEAYLYYKTEDLIYDFKNLHEPWRCQSFAAYDLTAKIKIPTEAQVFYFCIKGHTSNPDQILHATSGVFDRYTWGYVCSDQ